MAYIIVNMALFHLHSVEGEEAVGRRGRIWASKSLSPQFNPPHGKESPPGGLFKITGMGKGGRRERGFAMLHRVILRSPCDAKPSPAEPG